ncbi:MAG: DHH family phosphoesterase [Candidatus Woesearchaeota archaeon]
MKFIDIKKINEIFKINGEDILITITAKVIEVVNLQNLKIYTIDDGDTTLQLVKFSTVQPIYPDLKENCIATFTFKKSLYQGKVQGQIADVKNIICNTSIKEENLDDINLSEDNLFVSEDWRKLEPMLEKVAKIINNAIQDKKPIVISHHADCDGYASALILEKAILYKLKQRQPDLNYISNFYVRNASKTPYYDISDATKDISSFQGNFSRTNNKTPLFVILDNGSTEEDILAIKKLKIFNADIVVVDHHDPGKLDENKKSEICKLIKEHANPFLVNLNKEFSTSMLSLRLAYFITKEITHSLFQATLGGIADRCTGNPIHDFIDKSGYSEEYFSKLAKFISLEIFFTKYTYGELPLLELFKPKNEKQDKLIELYDNQMEIWEKQIEDMVTFYSKTENMNEFQVNILDADKLTLWNDYFSIGKLTAFTHRKNEAKFPDKNIITISTSDSMLVYRVMQQKDMFDGNILVAQLQEKLPHGRISGGGHNVAGSIKFIPAVKEELLSHIKEFIEKLN